MHKELCEFLEADQTFEWGENDCCMFAANWIKSITGIDHMAEFRGQYHDLDSARIALKTIGAGSLYATMRVKFGNPVKRGLVGDIAYSKQSEGYTLGICVGEYSLFIGDELHKVKNIECRFFKWAKR